MSLQVLDADTLEQDSFLIGRSFSLIPAHPGILGSFNCLDHHKCPSCPADLKGGAGGLLLCCLGPEI